MIGVIVSCVTGSMRSAWEDTDRRLHLLYDTWLYPVWMFMFVYQFIWLFYGFTTLRRRGKSFFLYKQIPVMPQSLYIFALFGTISHIGWIFLFINDFFYPLSSFCSACSFVLLGVALAISLHQMNQQKMFLEVNHLEKDIVAVVTLVQNGLGVCLTWVLFITITSSLSLLRFSNEISIEDVTSGVLVTLLLYTVLWTVLDMTTGRGTTLLLFSPYLTLFIIFLGVFLRNVNKREERNFIVSVIAMALSLALCIAKVVIFFIRNKHLLYSRKKSGNRSSATPFIDDDGERFRSWRSSHTELSRVSQNRNNDAIRRLPNEYVNTSVGNEYYNNGFQLRRINISGFTS